MTEEAAQKILNFLFYSFEFVWDFGFRISDLRLV
jgi:hypothetical protein